MSRKPTIVLVDADNTLWDTDAVFRDAQLLLLSLIEAQTQIACKAPDRLAFIRAYDQALAQKHHLHLRYPPQLLVRSVEAGLTGRGPEAASHQAIAGQLSLSVLVSQFAVDRIVAEYLQALSSTPRLLQGVAVGVRAAKAAGLRLFVMTEGRVEKQKALLELYELTGSFEGVWEMTKERSQFDRVVTRFAESQVVVIGDQPDRDIVPAKAAGCSTVLIPSRFKPTWQRDSDHETADHLATDFLDAVTWCIRADWEAAVEAR
ncbi:HAD family hydrolase [Aquabacterium sp.]|uniref:HAD family hydrolase n=1 Tax=Aquabacterium sp. TaxID=1872578 RepID=UPI003D6D7586